MVKIEGYYPNSAVAALFEAARDLEMVVTIDGYSEIDFPRWVGGNQVADFAGEAKMTFRAKTPEEFDKMCETAQFKLRKAAESLG